VTKKSEHWIPLALELERRRSGLPLAERKSAYARDIETRDLKIETLRRLVPAAKYAAAAAKSAGLGLSEVTAAALALQHLMRLERLDPEAAAPLRRKVLTGEIPARRMAEIAKEAALRSRNRARLETLVPWHEFVIKVSTAVEPDFSKTRYETSNMLFCLNADFEIAVNEPKRKVAVFLSPLSEHSAFYGKELSEQIPFLFMATAFYDRVAFCFLGPDEAELIHRIWGQADARYRRDIETYDLHAIVAKDHDRAGPEP
jgi:hypothetical protein